jgi:hypothetical protein
MNLQRLTNLGGIILIVAAITTFVVVGTTIPSTSDKSPFERDEVAEFLIDTNDNESAFAVSIAVAVFNDGIIGILLAAVFYVLFRDRNPMLATIALGGILIGCAAALMSDAMNILLIGVAEDFVEGGAGDVPPGDAATLQVGRFVGAASFALFNIAFTAYGTALVAIGALLLGPAGRINPPRWLGWLAVVAGLCAWLAWGVVVADPMFVFFPLNFLTTTIFSIGLGWWLLKHSDLEPAPMNA